MGGSALTRSGRHRVHAARERRVGRPSRSNTDAPAPPTPHVFDQLSAVPGSATSLSAAT
jgi:hypothetical protein